VVTSASGGGRPCVGVTGTRTEKRACVIVPPSPPGAHPFFDRLVAHPKFWKGAALRTDAEVTKYRQGSFKNAYYAPTADAMETLIADYPNVPVGVQLRDAIDETHTTFVPTGGLPTNPGMSYRIDGEILLYKSKVVTPAAGSVPAFTTVTVVRAHHGTTAAPHAAKALIGTGGNSLLSQVRIPLGTEDGHSYLFTWDAWKARGFRCVQLADGSLSGSGLSNYKDWQFGQGSGNDGSLGLEVRSRFLYDKNTVLAPDELAVVDMRRYLAVENPVTQDSLIPVLAPFRIKWEVWTRYWVLIEHIVGDWDRVSLWCADATRDPIQIYDRVGVETDSHRIAAWWVERNTSTDTVAKGRGELRARDRNFAALKDPTTAEVRAVLTTEGLTV
jgi:hypothetical protein